MQREKKPVLTIKKEFFKVQKLPFSKGVNPYFWSKNEFFFLLLDMVRISLERMLNGFAEKKRETFMATKNRIFESL